LLGGSLRIYMLSDQIIVDDEMHALHAIINNSYQYIFTHFFPQDVCTPLALIYKLIADSVGLNELTMRMPTFLAGVGLIIVVPLFIRNILGQPTAIVCAFFVAISPVLINYSRIARPYSIAVLLVMISIWAFYRWLFDREKKWAILFVVSSILGIYFHLLCAPAILGILLFGLVECFINPAIVNDKSRMLAILAMGLVVLLVVGVLFAAPFWNSSHLLLRKAANGHVSALTLKRALVLLFGVGNHMLLLSMVIGTICGSIILFKRNRSLAFMVIIVVGVQITSICVLLPAKVQYFHIFARYNLWLLPLFLICISTTLTSIRFPEAFHLKSYPGVLISAIFISLLFFTGPIPKTYHRPNNFLNSNIFTDIEIAPEFSRFKLNSGPISTFYKNMGKSNEDFSIVETPWYFMNPYNRLPIYQSYHKKNVIIGFVSAIVQRYTKSDFSLANSDKYSFRHFLNVAKKEKLKGKKIRYIILHKDIQNEAYLKLRKPKLDIKPLISRFHAEYGAPVFEDKDILVFLVDKVSGTS